MGPFFDENEKCVNDRKAMAEMLNRQYHMFSEPKLDKMVHEAKTFFQIAERSVPTLEDLDFNPADKIQEIDTISTNAVPGHSLQTF